MTQRIGIITFPGSLDERDAARAVTLGGGEAVPLWHDDPLLHGVDAVIIPGGFSYGDYLRCGAIAARMPVMQAIKAKAEAGVKVLGVCNGFQILLESGLLPGALMRNASLKFVCREVKLEVANAETDFTRAYAKGQIIRCPVAHHDGNYFADAATLDRIEGEGRVAFRYADNVNGSARNVAGVLNDAGNVLGMMPHPERAIDRAHGGTDGLRLFEAALGVLA